MKGNDYMDRLTRTDTRNNGYTHEEVMDSEIDLGECMQKLAEYEDDSIILNELTSIIESWRLETRFRNDDETGDYVKGYKNGYDKAIENVLQAIVDHQIINK